MTYPRTLAVFVMTTQLALSLGLALIWRECVSARQELAVLVRSAERRSELQCPSPRAGGSRGARPSTGELAAARGKEREAREQAFYSEPADAAWATRMKARIQEVLRAQPTSELAVIDCRSRSCRAELPAFEAGVPPAALIANLAAVLGEVKFFRSSNEGRSLLFLSGVAADSRPAAVGGEASAAAAEL